MWKCIHRGLRTSANLLKTDQSNGVCKVSSVICKDFDELPTHPKSLNSSTRLDDAILPGVNKRKCIADRNHVTGEACLRPEPLKGLPSTSLIATNHQSEASTCNPDVFYDSCEETSNADLVSCRQCRKIYGNNPENLHVSKIRPQSWLSRKLHLHYTCSCSSSTSTTRNGFFNNAVVRRPTYSDLPEEKSLLNNTTLSRKSDSPPNIHDPSSTFSFLQPYHHQKKIQLDLERKHSLKKRSQICHNLTSCLLKLPFLSYDFMRNKGLNQLYECILNKGNTEYSGLGNKSHEKERNEKSEEAEKESWRRHQVQQSLLEAIGLSSALLLGWFLVQFRIWHPCRERRTAEHQQRVHGARCGMFSRLIFSKGKNAHEPLNAIPSNSFESNNNSATEKQHPSKNGHTDSVDSGNDSIFEKFSELFHLDNLQEESFSSNFASTVASSETSINVEENQKQNASVAVEVHEKEPIPMPWYPQESKKIGPITLEQAIDEAGKSLEDAHAEVLLQLALEILEEGEESDDESPAVDLLTKAAQLGSSVAAFNLGICYEIGVGGVTKDLSKAYYWYKVASDDGHAAAMYNMAIYHAQGLAGLSVDTKLAHQLLEKASSFELPEAKDALTLLTSLKPTETEGLKQNNSILAEDHDISKSSSPLSVKDEDSDASYDCHHLSTSKTGPSHDKRSRSLGLSFSHMMAESLLSSLINEDDLSSEIALDNNLGAKQSDLKYVSAIALAH